MANKSLKRKMRAAGLKATSGEIAKDYKKYNSKRSKLEIKRELAWNKQQFNSMSGQQKQDERINKAFSNTYDKLLPPSGPSKSLGGEAIRAVGRISYRLFNDGDVYNKGYGRETVNPAVRAIETHVKDAGVQDALTKVKNAAKSTPYTGTGMFGGRYEHSITNLKKAAMKYASPKGTKRKEANTWDWTKE